jgi:hypothetical protein
LVVQGEFEKAKNSQLLGVCVCVCLHGQGKKVKVKFDQLDKVRILAQVTKNSMCTATGTGEILTFLSGERWTPFGV